MPDNSLVIKFGGDSSELLKEVKKVEGSLNTFKGTLKGVGAAAAGYFTADAIKAFVSEVVKVTSEFQKFEAVLTNTLGNNSAAKLVLRDIQEFAAKTPFSVQELTSSFVKLANQGFKPTQDELKKLGDLAAAMGKSFDQLTEAIIDAQTGEFERLKEFGIRAAKHGDQVTFTFKGVKKQVDFTAGSIREYILSLGDLSGVVGGMEAISKTLGGQISNLGDAWDTFLKTVGDGNKGVMSGTVSLLSQALQMATELVKTNAQKQDEDKINKASLVLNQFKEKQTLADQEAYLNMLYAKKFQLQMANVKAEKDWKNANYVRYQQNKLDVAALTEAIGLIAHYRQEVETSVVSSEVKKDEEAHKKYMKMIDDRLDRFRQMAMLKGGRIIDIRPVTEVKTIKNNPLSDMSTQIEEASKRIQPVILNIQNQLKTFKDVVVVDIAPAINGAFETMANGIGIAIGDMATGVGGFENITGALLAGLAGMATQLGQLAVGTGIAVAGIKKALQTLNPVVAIAGGIALIALGRAVSNRAAAISKGGGGGNSDSSFAGQPSNPGQSSLGAPIQVMGTVTVSGTDLKIALANQNRVDDRTRV